MKTAQKINWEPSSDIDPSFFLGFVDQTGVSKYIVSSCKYEKNNWGRGRRKFGTKFVLSVAEDGLSQRHKMKEFSAHNSARAAKIRAQQLENEKAPV